MSMQTWQRLDLAYEQLDTALSLFLERHSYAATITLAGAAERVLGQELRRRSEQAVLDWQFEETARVHAAVHGKQLK